MVFICCGCGMKTEPFIYECTGREYLTFSLVKEGKVSKNDTLLSDSSTYFVMKSILNTDTLISFIKYFPEGYFVQSSSFNKKADFLPENTYKISYRCGYFSRNDSLVIMQTWIDNYDGMYIGKAKIDGDSLIYYYFKKFGNNEKNSSNILNVYVKEHGTLWIN